MEDDTQSSGGDRRITSDTGPFAIIPEWLIDTDLPDRAFRLYAVLSRYADSSGYCWPSRRTLAERLHRSVDALDRAVKDLIDAGILEVTPRFDGAGDRSSNGYVIRRIQPDDLRRGGRESAATGGRKSAQTGGRKSAALTRTIENETQQEVMALPVGERQPAVRKRDAVWDAVMDACGIDDASVTKASRGAYNRAVKDLRDLGASPDDVYERSAVFRKRWPSASLTPTALARRWPECDPGYDYASPVRSTDEQKNLMKLVQVWEGEQ